jgi:hypothetical protein
MGKKFSKNEPGYTSRVEVLMRMKIHSLPPLLHHKLALNKNLSFSLERVPFVTKEKLKGVVDIM